MNTITNNSPPNMEKKMKNIVRNRSLLFLLIIAVSSLTYGQTEKKWRWVKQIGGDLWDISSGIACDSKNMIYITGSFHNYLECGSKKIESNGSQDVFIAKFDNNGYLQGLYGSGGRGSDQGTNLYILPNNDLLIIGELSDSAVFGRITLKVAGKQVFTAKMDNKGNFVWVSTISVDTEASLNLIGTDQDGTIYIGGTFSGSLLAGEKKVSSNGRKDIFLA